MIEMFVSGSGNANYSSLSRVVIHVCITVETIRTQTKRVWQYNCSKLLSAFLICLDMLEDAKLYISSMSLMACLTLASLFISKSKMGPTVLSPDFQANIFIDSTYYDQMKIGLLGSSVHWNVISSEGSCHETAFYLVI